MKERLLPQRITMEDVARQSGVSLTTVSLVLRDKPGIHEDTRQRVLAIARDLGYRRKVHSEPAPQSSSILRQVGILNKARADDDPQNNQFYAPVVAGIEVACRRQQVNLLYATVLVDNDNVPLEKPRMLQDSDSDGLLLIGAFVDSTIAQLIEHRTKPVVLVDAYATEQRFDSVISDNFRGAYTAVKYLVSLGHQHIGLITGSTQSYPSFVERRRGYMQAVHDLTSSQAFIADTPGNSYEIGESALDLLRRIPSITALFCCNDVTAIAVMRVLQAAGYRIPEDVSIIGFDNIELAEHVSPALTTMNIDKVGMGRLAIQLLTHRAEFPHTNYVTAVLQPFLVKRDSVMRLR